MILFWLLIIPLLASPLAFFLRRRQAMEVVNLAAFGALDDFERIGVGNRNHRHETRRMPRNRVLIELDQHVARAHGRALLDHRREASTVQLDRVDTDMQQDFGAFCRRDRDGVAGARQMHHDAVARRNELAFERIDADPVAEHAARKHRVGHVRERDDETRHRREQNSMAFGMALQTGLLDTSHLNISISEFR